MDTSSPAAAARRRVQRTCSVRPRARSVDAMSENRARLPHTTRKGSAPTPRSESETRSLCRPDRALNTSLSTRVHQNWFSVRMTPKATGTGRRAASRHGQGTRRRTEENLAAARGPQGNNVSRSTGATALRRLLVFHMRPPARAAIAVVMSHCAKKPRDIWGVFQGLNIPCDI